MASAPPPLPGVEHRTVRVGDIDVHVAEAGSGPPLLLLHGWPQHFWCWRHLIGPLAERHHVIAPDLRGHGWTDPPEGAYLKQTLADDAIGLLDALDLDRVTFVGHDWGAYTGFLVALAHPERIERLVALDIVPPWSPRPNVRHLALPAFLSYQAAVSLPRMGPRVAGSPAFIKRIITTASGPSMRWADVDLERYAERFRDPARARAVTRLYRTFLTREMPAGLRDGPAPDDLRVPTLLVQGERSFLHRFAGAGQRLGPTMGLEVIPGAGHFLPEEAPEAVLRLIL